MDYLSIGGERIKYKIMNTKAIAYFLKSGVIIIDVF